MRWKRVAGIMTGVGLALSASGCGAETDAAAARSTATGATTAAAVTASVPAPVDLDAVLADGSPRDVAAALVSVLSDPAVPDALLERAAAEADRLGEPNARRLALQRRLERTRGPSRPLELALAAAHEELGEQVEAITLYEQVLAHLPAGEALSALPVLERLARAREALGDVHGALAVRERALAQLEALDTATELAWETFLSQLWQQYAGMGRLEDLDRLATRVPGAGDDGSSPGQALVNATRGVVLGRLDRHAEAVAALETAVRQLEPLVDRRHPDLVLTRLQLASSLEAEGHLEPAGRKLTELVELLTEDETARPTLWASRAALSANLALRGESGRALQVARDAALDARRVLPAGHPLRLDALGDLAWCLAASDQRGELNGLLTALTEETALHLGSALGRRPATRERVLGEVADQLATLLSLDRWLERDPVSTWELLEQFHATAGRPTILRGSAADDPELAGLRRHAEAAHLRLEQLLEAERSDELVEATVARDEALARLDAALGQRDLPFVPLSARHVVQALPRDAALIGFDGLALAGPDDERPSPSVVAHVLDPDGVLTRHDLCARDDLVAALEAWHEHGAPLEGPQTEALRQLLLGPLEARLAGQARWLVRLDDSLADLPLDGLAGEVEVIQLPDLAGLVAPRPPWDGQPSLVTALAPDPGATAGPAGAPTRSPSPTSGPAADDIERAQALRALADAVESMHTTLGGPLPQRIGGPHVSRPTLGRMVAGVRSLYLALPNWRDDSAARLPRAARSARRPAPDVACGVASGFGLTGWASGRTPDGRLPGLASAEDMARLHLLGTDLVVCPTPAGEDPELRRAFHRAGARAVLMPRWDTDPASRSLLVGEFLRQHWEQGLPARQALRAAQAALLQAGRPTADVLGWRLTGPLTL